MVLIKTYDQTRDFSNNNRNRNSNIATSSGTKTAIVTISSSKCPYAKLQKEEEIHKYVGTI